jgi:hypothetical protein
MGKHSVPLAGSSRFQRVLSVLVMLVAVFFAIAGAGAAVAVARASSGPQPAIRFTDTGVLARATTSTPPATATPRPAIVPAASRIAAATRWINERRGIVGYAVVDSSGHLSGYHLNQQFVTASVVKAMLLVGYLRTHSTLTASVRSTLTSMIHVSDNNCATSIYHIVGDSGLRKVAKAAKMTHFSVSVSWGRAQLTPADQARFFYNMDKLLPKQHIKFARYLLSHISSDQSWGIPAAARPKGWTVFFKGGWRGTARGQLVHQVARLESRKATFSLAVMTDGDPSMSYGIATIRGVTRLLLGLRP